eukprot:10983946-Lingulodinium_polyedra.AAC.1
MTPIPANPLASRQAARTTSRTRWKGSACQGGPAAPSRALGVASAATAGAGRALSEPKPSLAVL